MRSEIKDMTSKSNPKVTVTNYGSSRGRGGNGNDSNPKVTVTNYGSSRVRGGNGNDSNPKVTVTSYGSSRGRGGNGNDSKENVCRIAILGCPGVGKTALTVRYLTKRFIGEYCPTLESIYKYQTQIDDDDVRIEILDTAGQIQESWNDGYALWCDCFIFVYSITDKYSFDQIIHIKRQVETVRRSTSITGILVGNKVDLLHDRQVPANEGSELADEIGCTFHEVSAADWTQVTNITELFNDLYRDLKRVKMAREGRQRKASSSVRFKQAIQKVISGKTPVKRTLSA